jgi:hypothetical protein
MQLQAFTLLMLLVIAINFGNVNNEPLTSFEKVGLPN